MTNGGALYVERDSSATFMGAASFVGNSVMSTDLPPTETPSGGFRSNYKVRSGGAVFNKVISLISLFCPAVVQVRSYVHESGCVLVDTK